MQGFAEGNACRPPSEGQWASMLDRLDSVFGQPSKSGLPCPEAVLGRGWDEAA